MIFFVFHLLLSISFCFFFFFNDTATTEIYTLSLHDALPISHHEGEFCNSRYRGPGTAWRWRGPAIPPWRQTFSSRTVASHVPRTAANNSPNSITRSHTMLAVQGWRPPRSTGDHLLTSPSARPAARRSLRSSPR